MKKTITVKSEISVAQAIANVARKCVNDNIDAEYIWECGYSSIRDVYRAEYGYALVTNKACTDYLQGLPSVCTIPFENYKILEMLAGADIVPENDDDAYEYIDQYWKSAGRALYSLVK